MEVLVFLLVIVAMIWGFNKFRVLKHRGKPESTVVTKVLDRKIQLLESPSLATTHEKDSRVKRSGDLRTSAISPPDVSVKDAAGQGQTQSFIDLDLCEMLEAISRFPAAEVFKSLSTEKQLFISEQLKEYFGVRERKRHARLKSAEFVKQKKIEEYEAVKFAIAENNDWFVAAKEGRTHVTPESLKQRTKTARELYSRKQIYLDTLLPEVDSKIKAVISQIESEEMQELMFQRQNLESLLLPFHKELDRVRRQVVVAQAKQRIRQRREEEARRQEEHQAFLHRVRTEELERSRILAEERRQERAEGIRRQVEERGIPYLVHFTPISNLASILEHGLKSRNALIGRKYTFTDEVRADGWLDWISLSVSFPNYRMFYSKRNSLDYVDGWAILLIRREALWELDCKFILTNAASYQIRMFRDDKWSSVEAFEDMFDYVEHRGNIPDYFTTDPQAEVMIKNEVPRDFIDMIVVERHADLKRMCGLGDIQVDTIPELFRWRSDFEHWQHFRLRPFRSVGEMEARF